MNITINKEYENLVPPLSDSEFQALKKSIKIKGMYMPIVISHGIVLDGHHRFKICKELGIEIKTITRDFDNKLDEKEFVIISNLRRRQLNDWQKVGLGEELLKIESERAKKRQILLGKTHGVEMHPLASNEAKGKATEIVSKEIGMSKAQFERGIEVKKQLREKPKEFQSIIKSIGRDEIKISTAYGQIKRKAEPLPEIPLPDGKFNVIYADPPWSFEMDNSRGAAQREYSTMQIEDICNLKIPSAEDAILFLWVPNSLLRQGMQVVEKWGFQYKTHFVWVKNRIGIGSWLRNQHEVMFIAVKGDIGTPETSNRYSSVINAELGKHSKKPEILYEMIEKMYPKHKYLELFARNKRDGWESWGNQIG